MIGDDKMWMDDETGEAEDTPLTLVDKICGVRRRDGCKIKIVAMFVHQLQKSYYSANNH